MSELVPQGNGHALTIPGQGPLVAGLDTLGSEDITLPYIRLTQAMSDDVTSGERRPGELVHSITGEVYPQPLEFVPVMVSITRSRFVDRTRVCFSPDGRTGIGDPGGDCATCPLAQWRRGTDGQPDSPPECARGYQYVVFLPGHEPLPMALILAKTSTKAGKKLNYMLKAYARRGSVFSVSAKKQQNNKGTFFVFDVERARDVTPEELQHMLELRQMLAGQTIVVEQDAGDFTYDDAEDIGNTGATGDDPY